MAAAAPTSDAAALVGCSSLRIWINDVVEATDLRHLHRPSASEPDPVEDLGPVPRPAAPFYRSVACTHSTRVSERGCCSGRAFSKCSSLPGKPAQRSRVPSKRFLADPGHFLASGRAQEGRLGCATRPADVAHRDERTLSNVATRSAMRCEPNPSCKQTVAFPSRLAPGA